MWIYYDKAAGSFLMTSNATTAAKQRARRCADIPHDEYYRLLSMLNGGDASAWDALVVTCNSK